VSVRGVQSVAACPPAQDFGLARLRDDTLVTRHPEVGTVPYMAPVRHGDKSQALIPGLEPCKCGVQATLCASKPAWQGPSRALAGQRSQAMRKCAPRTIS
jgi:hypothetical protein